MSTPLTLLLLVISASVSTMEESLLPGESSSNSWGRIRNRRRVGSMFDPRDAIAHGSAYQKAAALVDLV